MLYDLVSGLVVGLHHSGSPCLSAGACIGELTSSECLQLRAHRVLSLSHSRRHDSVSGMALSSGRGCFLGSCFAETLLPVLLEGPPLSGEGDQVRRKAGAVQDDIQRVYGPGQVHPAGAAHPQQTVCHLQWKHTHLPRHRAAQQQIRQCFPRETELEERRLCCVAHEQRARLPVRLVRVGEGRLLGCFPQH